MKTDLSSALKKRLVNRLIDEEQILNEDNFVDCNLVAECHISLEKLTAKVQDFNAAKDDLMLANKND